jgi:hypothetical protein
MLYMTGGHREVERSTERLSLGELAALLRQPPPACWLAFRRLAQIGDSSALQLLVAETKDPDEFRRRAAVEALGRSPLGAQAVGDVRRLLSDTSPYVVRSALEAAAALRDDDSHDAILRYLNDDEPSTRSTALHALDAVWRDEDSDAVLALESHDADGDIRKEAGWLLRHHLPANPRPLLQRWLSSEIPRERVWAAELMRETVAYYDRSSLEKLLRDTDGHVREAAKRTLAAIQQSSGPIHARWMALIAPGDSTSAKGGAGEVLDEGEGFPRPEVVFIDDSESGWFLFQYTLAGQFGGDSWHESLEQAKAQANYEHGATLGDWIPVPNDVDPIEFARQRVIGADRRM